MWRTTVARCLVVASAIAAACTEQNPPIPHEDIEVSCDGFDNDGDGRVDVSRPVLLGETTIPYWFTWVSTGDRLFAAWAESSVPRFAMYGPTFEQLASAPVPFQLPPNTVARPLWMRDGAALTWSETDAGIDHQIFQRVAVDGGFSWRFSVERQEDPTGTWLRAAEANDQSCIALVWNNVCEGWLRKGMTIDADGSYFAGPVGLLPQPGGPGCGTESSGSVVPLGRSGFALAAVGRRADGTSALFLNPFTCDMDAGTRVEIPTPLEWPAFWGSDVVALDEPDEFAVLSFPWHGKPEAREVLWHVRPDGGGGVETIVDYDGTLESHAQSIVTGTSGPFLAWAAIPNSNSPIEFFAQRGDHRIELTPSLTLASGSISTASLHNGLSAMGFIVDGGIASDGGIRLLRYGQLFCEP